MTTPVKKKMQIPVEIFPESDFDALYHNGQGCNVAGNEDTFCFMNSPNQLAEFVNKIRSGLLSSSVSSKRHGSEVCSLESLRSIAIGGSKS